MTPPKGTHKRPERRQSEALKGVDLLVDALQGIGELHGRTAIERQRRRELKALQAMRKRECDTDALEGDCPHRAIQPSTMPQVTLVHG